MDIYTVISILFWAIVNYLIADFVAKKCVYITIKPALYALGSILLGGIYPLIFLVIKYVYCSYRAKNDEGDE